MLTRGEIINSRYFMTLSQQTINQCATDKTSASCDNKMHINLINLDLRTFCWARNIQRVLCQVFGMTDWPPKIFWLCQAILVEFCFGIGEISN